MEKQISKETAEEFARENNMTYWEVSAKTNMGLVELFDQIGKQYLESQQEKVETVQKVVVKQEIEKKSGCC